MRGFGAAESGWPPPLNERGTPCPPRTRPGSRAASCSTWRQLGRRLIRVDSTMAERSRHHDRSGGNMVRPQPPTRSSATPAARALLAGVVAERGRSFFHQIAAAAATAPGRCATRRTVIDGDADVLLGHIGGAHSRRRAAIRCLEAHRLHHRRGTGARRHASGSTTAASGDPDPLTPVRPTLSVKAGRTALVNGKAPSSG